MNLDKVRMGVRKAILEALEPSLNFRGEMTSEFGDRVIQDASCCVP